MCIVAGVTDNVPLRRLTSSCDDLFRVFLQLKLLRSFVVSSHGTGSLGLVSASENGTVNDHYYILSKPELRTFNIIIRHYIYLNSGI